MAFFSNKNVPDPKSQIFMNLNPRSINWTTLNSVWKMWEIDFFIKQSVLGILSLILMQE